MALWMADHVHVMQRATGPVFLVSKANRPYCNKDAQFRPDR